MENLQFMVWKNNAKLNKCQNKIYNSFYQYSKFIYFLGAITEGHTHSVALLLAHGAKLSIPKSEITKKSILDVINVYENEGVEGLKRDVAVVAHSFVSLHQKGIPISFQDKQELFCSILLSSTRELLILCSKLFIFQKSKIFALITNILKN